MTTRKIGRVLFAVTDKLSKVLFQKYGELIQGDMMVLLAMEDPAIKNVIYDYMRKDSIKLVRKETGEPLFRRETTLIGEKGERAVNESPTEDQSKMDVDPEEAELHVDDVAIEKIG